MIESFIPYYYYPYYYYYRYPYWSPLYWWYWWNGYPYEPFSDNFSNDFTLFHLLCSVCIFFIILLCLSISLTFLLER